MGDGESKLAVYLFIVRENKAVQALQVQQLDTLGAIASHRRGGSERRSSGPQGNTEPIPGVNLMARAIR